jgi:hypothetical protein
MYARTFLTPSNASISGLTKTAQDSHRQLVVESDESGHRTNGAGGRTRPDASDCNTGAQILQ